MQYSSKKDGSLSPTLSAIAKWRTQINLIGLLLMATCASYIGVDEQFCHPQRAAQLYESNKTVCIDITWRPVTLRLSGIRYPDSTLVVLGSNGVELDAPTPD